MADTIESDLVALSKQLEEVDLHEAEQKGKYPAAKPPDNHVASAYFRDEIIARIGFLEDLKITHSIANAVHTDGQALANMTRSDSQAHRDQSLAAQMSRDEDELEAPPPYTESNALVPDEEDHAAWILDDSEDSDTPQPSTSGDRPGASATYIERQEVVLQKLARKQLECCACRDEFRSVEVVHLNCDHPYCKGCLKRLLLRATDDHTLLPPRCCGRKISSAMIRSILSVEERRLFEEAEIEFATEDKTYCSNAKCEKFIPPSQIRADTAVCNHCGSTTCTMCKRSSHRGDCPADPALQATLALATDQGWQRCYACRAMVELNIGCNHMRYVVALIIL